MAVTNYLWDGENYLGEFDDAGELTAVFTNEPRNYAPLVSQHRDGRTNYYHFDGVGSTRELTDASGTVTDTWLYDAWGVELARTGTTDNSFTYVGERRYYRDEEIEGYYVINRTFAPITGQWTCRDPLWSAEVAGLYLYVRNVPVGGVDPSGLWIMRDSEDPSIWGAEENDDFETLVTRLRDEFAGLFSDTKANIACIRPIVPDDMKRKRTMEHEWIQGRPAAGECYDAGNLLNAWNGAANAPSLVVSVGSDRNNYIRNVTNFYRVNKYNVQHFADGGTLGKAIRDATKEGLNPVLSLTIIGHSWRSQTLIGSQFRQQPQFKLTDVRTGDAFRRPTFAAAVQGMLPLGCLFRTDATIRLIGCRTSEFAHGMAKNVLRSGATAYGTNLPTWTRVVAGRVQLGWGRPSANRGTWVPDVNNSWADTPEDYYNHLGLGGAMNQWAEWRGES